MTAKMATMAMDELGDRIKQERLRRGLNLSEAARAVEISRDTWRKIEAGASVQDAKRQKVLEFLEMTTHPVTRYHLKSEPIEGQDRAPIRLRAIVARNMIDLHRQAYETAVEIALSDPEDALRVLRDASEVSEELWRSAQASAGAMERKLILRLGEQEPEADVSDPDDEIPAAAKKGQIEEPGEFNG